MRIHFTGTRVCVLLLALLGALALAGCSGIGPGTVARDRFDYSTSMTESWKRQTLLNIIRLRYMDPPSFVDVGQIVAGYSLETGINAGAEVAQPGAGDTFGSVGGRMVFTDRPTITYTPLTGSRFVRGLMAPLPPESLFYTIQSGYAADAILKVGTISMNGLRNEEITIGGYRPPDPKFIRAVELMHKIQVSGAVGMKILQDQDKHQTKLITFRSKAIPPETLQDIAEFRELMGLNPDALEFRLVFGGAASNDQEIAVQTRSLLHILAAIAVRADVPAEHVREGRAVPGIELGTETPRRDSHVHIHCSKEKPKESFVSVEYRKHWFWVDDRDLVSKRSFSFLMMLFTLADTGEKEALPLITIPAQ